MNSRKEIAVHQLDLGQAEAGLIDGSLDAVLVFPEDLTENLLQGADARLEIVVEGSNAGQAKAIPLALGAVLGQEALALRPSGPALDLEIETRYLFGGEQLDFLDSFAPVYIAFFVYFFVFMLTGVSFLRERTQGTMERLFATPITRAEIALGYMFGFGLFALIQSAVILLFTIYVVQIQFVGNLALVFVLLGLLALGAVNTGIFFSTYVNRAMTDVMIRGYGLSEVALDLVILFAFAVGALVLSATTLRRQFI